MLMALLDTSYAIAMHNTDDPYHSSAEEWYRLVRRERWSLLTTTAILTEIGDGFAQKGRWAVVEPFLLSVFNDPTVHIVPVGLELLDRAIELRRRRLDKRWGLTDCISFIVMTDYGVRWALTADQDFVQAGFRALLREPLRRT
jgi:uncharacterized protein